METPFTFALLTDRPTNLKMFSSEKRVNILIIGVNDLSLVSWYLKR
jgi:hypothetical protein